MPAGDMRVLMMPDFRRDNPYQQLLAQGLETLGVEVAFPTGYRRGLPLRRACRTGGAKFDLLHLHWLSPYIKGSSLLKQSGYYLKTVADTLAVQAGGTRIVWTVHNGVSHEAKHPSLERLAFKRLYRQADGLIVHDEPARSFLAQTYGIGPERSSVIPHGHFRDVYGPALDKPEARRALGLPESGHVYLNFGMQRPYKGVEHLLEVWKRGWTSSGDTLVIAGKPHTPSYGDQLGRLAGSLAGVRLDLTFIPDEKLPLYFSAADVVVLPFNKILTSGSTTLAVSYAKPVIAPRTGGIPDVVGAADELLYDPDDAQGLEAAMLRSKTTDLNALASRAAAACGRLDWLPIAEATLQTYRKALRRS